MAVDRIDDPAASFGESDPKRLKWCETTRDGILGDMSKRHLIGLLTNDLVGTYQYSFWSGMKAAAREEDCDVVSFNGGESGSLDPIKSMRNVAFQNVQQTRPDALILLAPVVANSSGIIEIENLIKSFGSTPIITIGIDIPGHPAMIVNNASGMDALVEHVITVHDRKKFAFVGGPVLNPDAQQRRDTFLRVLARHGIAIDPASDIVGEFDFGITKQRVAALLRSGADFNALVAANDDMALAALEALKEFGRRIPDDVVVTGFDDIDESSHSFPALTTVRQPVFEQGRTSLLMTLDKIEGTSVAPVTTHTPSLILRGSCGCLSSSMSEAGRHLAQSDVRCSTGNSLGSAEHLRSVNDQCSAVLGGSRYAPQLEEFVASLCHDALHPQSDTARSLFVTLIDSASHPDDEYDRWQVFLSRLRIASLRYLPADPSTIFAFEGILHQMRVLIQERTTQSAMVRSAQVNRWSRSVHETACRMLGKFDSDHLFQTLAEDAKDLQIATLQFLVREPDLAEGDFRLALSIVRGTRVSLPRQGSVLSFGSAFRAITKRAPLRSSVVVEPLFFGGDQLGFLLLELNSRRGMLLDSLRGQISASLMGSRILHSVVAGQTPRNRNASPVLL